MDNLRIVFMGTPDFAVATLHALIEANQNIVGVITAPDKPAGRGRKLKQSAVKEYALKQNLNILQPTNLKNQDFLESLNALNVDLQIVVAFRMLPKQVWSMPKLGTFNLHASLLPDYRGAAPINWVVIIGETKTGVTTFFINEKIDTGGILLQKEIKISPITSAGDLHDELMLVGSELVVQTVQLIQNNDYQIKNQPVADLKPAPKLNKNNCKIDWNQSLNQVFNHIRGLSPYPAAYSSIYNNNETIEIKIYKTSKIKEEHSFKSGKIVFTKKEIKVAVKGGFINILELKLAGKRKMDTKSLLNGYTFSEGSKMI
ncbi:MAG: methionyl-tRNA formyltransferase [Flavobacteriaceae bacterium]|nr:methionyl-tRNA formyltransferase [Flavobacteriaceae bacterium]